jgi:hypothetical protein
MGVVQIFDVPEHFSIFRIYGQSMQPLGCLPTDNGAGQRRRAEAGAQLLKNSHGEPPISLGVSETLAQRCVVVV